MRYVKYSKKAVSNAKDGDVFFRLFQLNDDDLVLTVVDSNGDKLDQGGIVGIDSDFRTLVLLNDHDSDISGLKTDMEGFVFHKTTTEIDNLLSRNKECGCGAEHDNKPFLRLDKFMKSFLKKAKTESTSK